MQKQYYTIVVFPGNTGNPRKFQIPKVVVKSVFYISLTLLVTLTFSSFYFSKKYITLMGDTAELIDLKREAKLQKIQVEKFSQEVKNFENEMSRLSSLEKKLKVMANLEDSSKTQEKNWGLGGPYGLTQQSLATSFEKEASTLIEKLGLDLSSLNIQAKEKAVIFQAIDEVWRNNRSLYSAIPLIWPTRGWVTSEFGLRKSPFSVHLSEKHDGLDIAASSGTPIRAPADGKVVAEGRDAGYGNMIEIDHGYGYLTRYGHNSKHVVRVGERVKRGQIIGYTGNTGRSTGPHLHYEIILNGRYINPRDIIIEAEGG